MTTANAWCVATLLVLSVTTLGQAQSLVDVARQENQRRSAVTHPSKVYTNADARPVTDSPPTPETPASVTSLREQPTRRNESPESRAQVQGPRSPAIVVHPGQTGSSAARRGPAERTTNDMQWHRQQPIIIINGINGAAFRHTFGPRSGNESSNVNTAREQAMANFMRDAGFGGARAPTGPR